VDPDEIISQALAGPASHTSTRACFFDAAEALMQIGRRDLAATYAARSYGLAVLEKDALLAARALTLIVSRLGATGARCCGSCEGSSLERDGEVCHHAAPATGINSG